MQSLQFLIPGKVWGIGRGVDAVLPFTINFFDSNIFFGKNAFSEFS
jgi:hypothetical protein